METVDAALRVRAQDQNRAEAGLLEEEDAAQRLGPVEVPTSEEPQAPASEPDQSTGPLPSAQGKPTSKLGTESEMPEEASEPDRQDRQNQEIQTPASGQQGRAWERLSRSPDAARWIDLVQASTVMENSTAMALRKSCSSEQHCPHE